MQFEVGLILEGKVTGITKFGAFVELPEGKTGMVHISEIAPTFVKEIRDYVTENQVVKVKILSVGEDGKISLSMKKAMEEERRAKVPAAPARKPSSNADWQAGKRGGEPVSFEDMISKFKKMSDEKMSDLKRVTEAKRGGFSKRSGQSR